MKRDVIPAMSGYRTSEDSADKIPDLSLLSGTGFCALEDKAIKL